MCGISGQDGAYLAKLLLDRGYEVSGTSRDAQMSGFGNLARLGIREQVKLESMSRIFRTEVAQKPKGFFRFQFDLRPLALGGRQGEFRQGHKAAGSALSRALDLTAGHSRRMARAGENPDRIANSRCRGLALGTGGNGE